MARRGKRGGYERRSRVEWERLVAESERSELSLRAFCAQNGIAESSFGHWRRKLREEREAPPAGGFIELGPIERTATPWDVELELGDGVVLRLRRG